MDVPFNIALGREVEFYNRVDNNDPANSVLVLMVIKTGSVNGILGLPSFDTFAAILAGGYTEVTNTNYTRKTLDQTSLTAWTPDDTNKRVDLGLGVVTWTNPAAGDNWDIGVVGYDSDSTGGTDSGIVPITAHELREDGAVIVPVGSPVAWDLSNWISAVW